MQCNAMASDESLVQRSIGEKNLNDKLTTATNPALCRQGRNHSRKKPAAKTTPSSKRVRGLPCDSLSARTPEKTDSELCSRRCA